MTSLTYSLLPLDVKEPIHFPMRNNVAFRVVGVTVLHRFIEKFYCALYLIKNLSICMSLRDLGELRNVICINKEPVHYRV